MFSLVFASVLSFGFAEPLSLEGARSLVEATPDFIMAAKRGGCPKAELLWASEGDCAFQVRNPCSKAPSGLIGNYVVDRSSGEVWIGVDRDKRIRSKQLQKLRERLTKGGQAPGGR